MRLAQWLLVGLLALGTSGCAGYRLGPVNGAAAGARTVQVVPFQNQTLEAHLTDAVTQQLRKQLQLDGTARLIGPSRLVRAFPGWFDNSLFLDGLRRAERRRAKQSALV